MIFLMGFCKSVGLGEDTGISTAYTPLTDKMTNCFFIKEVFKLDNGLKNAGPFFSLLSAEKPSPQNKREPALRSLLIAFANIFPHFMCFSGSCKRVC